MKTGVVANIDLALVPADGEAHLHYGYEAKLWVSLNYHEIDDEALAAHPEILGYVNEDSTLAYFRKHGIPILH